MLAFGIRPGDLVIMGKLPSHKAVQVTGGPGDTGLVPICLTLRGAIWDL